MNKLLLMFAIVTIIIISSCHRPKFYQCVCDSVDTFGVYSYNGYNKDEVYSHCKQHQDSTGDSCMVLIHN